MEGTPAAVPGGTASGSCTAGNSSGNGNGTSAGCNTDASTYPYYRYSYSSHRAITSVFSYKKNVSVKVGQNVKKWKPYCSRKAITKMLRISTSIQLEIF